VEGSNAQTTDDGGDTGSGALGGCFCLLFFFALFLVPWAIWIPLLIWVHNDAKGRGMDNPGIWVVVLLLAGLIGLIIYLVIRPDGNKYPCPSCGKKRLQQFAECPFCHFSRYPKKVQPPGRCPGCGYAVMNEATFCPSCYGNLN